MPVRLEPSPGKDPLAAALVIHFPEQPSFQQQRISVPTAKTSNPGQGHSRALQGELPPCLSAQRRMKLSKTYLGCPTTATSSHLSCFFFHSFFFSTLQTSNFALGMSRMKCHLPIKRETEEKAMHHITYKFFEIKASFRL